MCPLVSKSSNPNIYWYRKGFQIQDVLHVHLHIYIHIISNQQICEDAHCLFFDSIEFVGMVLNIVSWVKKRHHLITLEAEQPGSSCLKDCPYISHILTTMGPSFFRRMWMGTYGHWASKPSQLWGSW